MIYTKINEEKALNFLKENKANKEHIYISSNELWVGAYNFDKLIGCIGFKKNRIRSFYVKKDFRKQGVGLELLNHILIYANDNSTTYATTFSKKLFEKVGFKPIWTNKNNITFMRREKDV